MDCRWWAGPRSYFESLSTSGPTQEGGFTLTLALSPQGRGDWTPQPLPWIPARGWGWCGGVNFGRGTRRPG